MPTILISRTDAIGDVVLTLPLAGILREHIPESRIVVLGTSYTRPVLQCCEHIDEVLDWDELARLPEAECIEQLRGVEADIAVHVFPRSEIARVVWKAGVKKRIGTTHRLYHFRYCNKLIGLGRKKSPHHEAILNIMLAQSLLPGMSIPHSTDLWPYYGLTRPPKLPERFREVLSADKFNLVLHTKSRGSAAEWESDRWRHLIDLLPKEQVNIMLTGTAEEGERIRSEIGSMDGVSDLSGTMTLEELLAFLAVCDGVVAASTGPLHIAAALGKRVLGLFPDTPPIHPGRWAPIGRSAEVVAGSINSRGFIEIGVENVFTKVTGWLV